MNLESNKIDFEKALAEMKESIELLEHCVDDAIIQTLTLVVDEYEGHLQSDIDEADSKIEDLTDQIRDKDSTIEALNDEISGLLDVIDNL